VLEIDNLSAAYGSFQALFGVSLRVDAGEAVGVIGPNGAGKTTLMRVISGLLPGRAGTLAFEGRSLNGVPAYRVVTRGIAHVPENRRLFPKLTVEENLRVGAYTNASAARDRIARAYGLFPVLEQRRKQVAGYLSGGEQQMLAIARAMMGGPRYLLLDEPSLGLAPLVVQQIRDLIVEINRMGTSVLLVEQNANMALSIAQHGYVMEAGKIVMDKPAAQMREDEDVREFYLGFRTEGRAKSLRDVKHYKRRKRWLS
jgi:branched-chain amino acid transport system ATP-binding protein